MVYAFKIAIRYLTASKAQTILLVVGVAVGVFIFIFMSALIGGLAEFIISSTVGDISHVTIEAVAEVPTILPSTSDAPRGSVLAIQQEAGTADVQLRSTEAFVPLIEALPGVVAVSSQVTGPGFVTRGAQVLQVSVIGLEPGKESAILDLDGYIIAGTARLDSGSVVIGKTLAEDLKISLGQTVRVKSSAGVEVVLTLSGIFEIGQGGADRATAYVSRATARNLFGMPQGVTRIEIKLADLYEADAMALRVQALTGLEAKSWTEQAAQLLDALNAQAQVGYILKTFAMITIIIGVSSALLLSTYRRRPEIGIMRAMGAARWFVLVVFVSQGALIGLMGGLLGAAFGYLALLGFPTREEFVPGDLPIDIRQGAYGMAILLTALGAIAASILPARAAARVDPVTAIGQ